VEPVVDEYKEDLDRSLGIRMQVRFERRGREIVSYAVVLLLRTEGAVETVRVYDSAHGFNEMHRHTRAGGKQSGKLFHSGTVGEGMRAAIGDVKSGYDQMIEGWER
jgi:hypothetical protein